ncbi:Uncharacterized protein C26F1.08c [Candida viswanathii]|uniref:Uncharacterized protein C26F1.08c n=1 Tax=Candida viswanathii TaxID=5486 RepID=A0A367Y7J4_9ASCO|nr:Uncharacterized protein C26F1.08c [Candida viswanathii]
MTRHEANCRADETEDSVDSYDEESALLAGNFQIRSDDSMPRYVVNRQNSVILAHTGERVHRSITFTTPNDTSMDSDPVSSTIPSRSSWLFQKVVTPMQKVYYNEVFRSVFKCSMAYFLASLGVYYTPFDEWLGGTDSKHVIATVAVYFHPARTKGSMTQTLMFVAISIVYSITVSLGCRFISAFFYREGEDELSHVIDLIISSVALGVISFMKQKVNKLTFNTACSLACISIVACIVKEGSTNSGNIPLGRIESTFQVVVTGCVISVGCCYLIWPLSAVKELRTTLNSSYNLFSQVISILVRRFVAGEQFTVKDTEMIEKLKGNINSLTRYLEEAQYELCVSGKEREWEFLQKLVASTISLARHLQALTAATRIQTTLLHENHHALSGTPSFRSFSTEDIRPTPSVENMAHNMPQSVNQVHNSLQLFDLFVYFLAPSIKSLVFTIKGVLSEVPFEKIDEENPRQFASTTTLQYSLDTAIKLFEEKQEESFDKLYSQNIFTQNTEFNFKTDQEEVAACCGNFASLLSQFASELLLFIKLSEQYDDACSSPRSWSWLKWWSNKKSKPVKHEQNSLHAALDDLRDQYGLKLPKRPENEPLIRKWSYKLWKWLKVFKRTDVQFGIRVGLGAACVGVFAFIPATKDLFSTWRLEWALTIYCIMMNKSLGGTTMTVKWRIIGTFLGAFTSFAMWNITDANVYALCITGILISIPSFYIILYWKRNNAFGRFILLTYNLTALYSYSMVQKDSEDDHEGGENPIIGQIAFHRFIAVSIGIVWALIMATWFLPNSARLRLKNGLSVLWLRLGVMWNSDPLEYDPETKKLVGFKAEEGTNKLLAECETLLKQAPVEFRLKGVFPASNYSKLIKDTSAIIDAFQNLDLLIKVDPTLSNSEEFVIKYIQVEREEVEQRIFLVFYMLASAMKLGLPIPSKPASIDHAKDRMLYKLSDVRRQQDNGLVLKNADFILLYSYILVATTISEQLDKIMTQTKVLLGEINEEKFQLV